MSTPILLQSRRPTLLIALLVLTLGTLFMFAPHFFSVRNVTNVLVQSSTLAMLAIGMSFVMIGGGIDLSAPATMAFSAVIGALALKAGAPAVFCALVMILTGAAIGAFNGFAVGYMRMIPFVVTLATRSRAAPCWRSARCLAPSTASLWSCWASTRSLQPWAA
jgi:ribose/xylose/arabinose/galactoside ABC-type transport system permease subunit